ncbi:MAG: SUMF1/EgtB/PvdO family nonheme iron enzyme [Polyangiaceae bacterium]|nr:SUMF1/EgtB/PvdO family nonheme iron enzyme [Polyangiaceae bacterium]
MLKLLAHGLIRGVSCIVLPTLCCGLLLAACDKSEGSPPTDGAPSATSSASAVPARPVVVAPLAGERVDIPAGSFNAGSRPGEPGRDPELEARSYQLELGAFSIDRLPYPNDPEKQPLTGVSRDEAQKLCAKEGARLCTELEWERACKGPESNRFATGNTWDPACADEPRKCASALNVLGLGASLKEWTASDKNPESEGDRDAILRGAFRKEKDTFHRCATRRTAEASTQSEEIGFRCCKGAPNAAVVPEPKAGDPFKKRELKGDELTKLLLADERTKALAKDLIFFSEPEAAHTVVSRGPGDRKGFGFTVAALEWNPVAGANYLVVSARSGKDTSFVLAYRLIDDKQYELASSFIMYGEPGPVALAYSDSIRVRLHFSSCWGCPGETGKILFRNPDEVVILQP